MDMLSAKEIREYIVHSLKYYIKQNINYWGIRSKAATNKLLFGVRIHSAGGCTLLLPISYLKNLELLGHEYKRVNHSLPIRVKIRQLEQLKRIITK